MKECFRFILELERVDSPSKMSATTSEDDEWEVVQKSDVLVKKIKANLAFSNKVL